MSDETIINETPDEVAENGAVDIIESLRQTRAEVADVFGKTKVLDVPGYKGLLAVEYQYISSEVTEKISREIRRETRNVNGSGVTLLASLDTLIAASKRVLIRDKAEGSWTDESGQLSPGVRGIDGDRPVNFRGHRLAEILRYDAGDNREVVLGLFGSEHSVIQQQILLSNWLTDRSRTADEDFFG